MRFERPILCGVVAVGLMLVPSLAFADVGLPMIVVALPGMAVMFIPIVAVEAYAIGRVVGMPFSRALGPAALANAVSTVIGIPGAWLLVALTQGLSPLVRVLDPGWQATGPALAGAVLSYPAWLPPYPGIEHAGWTVFLAMLLLLVPFFFASWLVEHWIVRLTMRDTPPAQVRRGVFAANVASYLMLAAVVVVAGLWAI